MSVPEPQPRLNAAFLALAGLALLLRFWTSLCFFPIAEWNNVRLAPTFMLFFGSTPYPGINAGPVTTWIYGPVPLLMNAPAVLGHSVVPALLIAGVITLVIAAVSAIFGTKAAARQLSGTSTTDGMWAVLLCLAFWPNPSLQYIQADNFAVAFGLVSNFWLLRKSPQTKRQLWLAAVCAALAVWSKQPSIVLILAQLLWLGLTAGMGAVAYYAAACLTTGLLLGGVFVAWFGFPELWLNLVQIPTRLPFAGGPVERTWECWMQLVGYVLLPAIGCVAMFRTIWKKDSPWLLPTITWLSLLPPSVVALYKIGGATNSLNGFLYLLPIAALAAVKQLRRLAPFNASAWLAFLVLAILTQQLRFSPLLPLRPMATSLSEANELARKLPDQVYFPWNPLVTFFSDHKFYDVEDGFFTRQAAQIPFDANPAKHRLPSRWTMTALPGWRRNGLYRKLQPPDAKIGAIGTWTVYYWPQALSPAKPD